MVPAVGKISCKENLRTTSEQFAPKYPGLHMHVPLLQPPLFEQFEGQIIESQA
jgi:hypothetical protein